MLEYVLIWNGEQYCLVQLRFTAQCKKLMGVQWQGQIHSVSTKF